jgi:hypothetical protein
LRAAADDAVGAAKPVRVTGGSVTGESPGGVSTSTRPTPTSSRSRARPRTSSSRAPASASDEAWNSSVTVA